LLTKYTKDKTEKEVKLNTHNFTALQRENHSKYKTQKGKSTPQRFFNHSTQNTETAHLMTSDLVANVGGWHFFS